MVKTIIAGRLEVLENVKGIAQTNKNLQRHAIFLKIVGRLQKKRMLAARRDQNFDALGEAEKLIKRCMRMPWQQATIEQMQTKKVLFRNLEWSAHVIYQPTWDYFLC